MVRQNIQLDTVGGGGDHAKPSIDLEKAPYQFEVNLVSLLKTSSVRDVGRRVSELSPVVNFSTTTELYRNRLHKGDKKYIGKACKGRTNTNLE